MIESLRAMTPLRHHGLGVLLLTLSCHAAAADLPRPALPITLGNLFTDNTVRVLAQGCAARFPDASPTWLAALSAWQTTHAPALAALRDVTDRLEAAARTAPRREGVISSAELVAFRDQGPLLVLSELARRPDAEARPWCQTTLDHLFSETSTGAQLERARLDGLAALDRIAAAPR